MKNWSIGINDFVLEDKTLDFDYKICELSERILTHELISSSGNNNTIYGTIWGTKDHSMRPVIELKLKGCVSLICQLCLEPFDYSLDECANLVVFEDDKSLQQALNNENNIETVVSNDGALDLLHLIEEQILLAIPFSPKHKQCKNEKLKINENIPNPFSVLKN